MTRSRILFVLTIAFAGCGSAGTPRSTAAGGAAGDDVGGTGGDAGSGGGGDTVAGTGGKGPTGSPDAAAGNGAGGEAGAGAGGAGGELAPDAAVSGGSGGTGGDGTGGSGGEISGRAVARGGDLGWYEAEAGVITGRALKSTCMACPMTPAMKPGDVCCSGGGEVTWLVSHGNGEVQFNMVMAPSDGMYDVTWWYYCARNDNFGDKNCGGQTDPAPTASGCRPHQFYVNGSLMTGAYHFPCFDGMWNVVRAATVVMPLKAGANTIKLHAPPPRDSVNVDAIEIFPTGKGLAPVISSRPDLTGH